MSFVWRMALREARAAWRRLVLFFVALALGVAAIAGVRSLLGGVRAGLAREARGLLAADVLIQTNRALNDDDDGATRAAIERHLAGPAVRARTEAISTATMARPADAAGRGARLVELRGVEPLFPLYGEIELAGGQRYAHALLRDHGALAAPELFTQLGLRVGDRVVLGTRSYTLRGVLVREPGRRPSAFSLGPRVLVDLADLRASGLLEYGSRALHQTLLRVDEPAVGALAAALRREFAAQYVSVRTYSDTGGEVDQGLRRAEGFLSLVGFAILVLGGVGVASVVRVFVQERLATLAVLKCLGASGAQVLAVDVLQVLLLSVAGGGCGLVLAYAGLAALPGEWTAGLGVAHVALTPPAALQGLGVGLSVALLFALPPLIDARRVKPLLLLRHEPAPAPARFDFAKLAAAGALGAGLCALAVWQAGSWRAGLLAAGGFAVVLALAHAAGAVLVRLTARAARRARFPLRQALLRLGRPGNQTRPVMLAVALGSFFILAVSALKAHVVDQFTLEWRADAPDLFLIDVQPDQADAVRAFIERATGRAPRLVPVLRARVTGVRGRDVHLDSFEDVRGRGLGREFVVTWRDHLEPNERLLSGRWWSAGEAAPGAPLEVSVERTLARRQGLSVGDEMRFDILGRQFSARVASVREVTWSDVRSGGFVFVFRPGALRGAPQTYLVFARGPAAGDARARLQADLAEAFPNVSALDLRDVLVTARALAGQVARAVEAVGAVTLGAGVLILLGAVAVTRRQRRYEAAVLRTLGARTRGIVALLALEYAVLGALAGTVGALGALGFDALATRQLLDIPWRPALGESLAGIALTAVGVGLVGLAASADVVRRKPLGVLRAE